LREIQRLELVERQVQRDLATEAHVELRSALRIARQIDVHFVRRRAAVDVETLIADHRGEFRVVEHGRQALIVCKTDRVGHGSLP
jgi:hypothetical protein